MATDVDAQNITINYEGGSLEMTIGNAKWCFGEDSDLISGGGVSQTVAVKGHSRTKVIGGGSTTISPFTYTYNQWPASSNSMAAGGLPVAMWWVESEGEWISRVSGPLWKLADFLNANALQNTWFQASGGKTYGPFKKP